MSKYVHSAGQSLLLAISLFGLFSSLFIRSISLFIDTPWSAFSKANSRTAQSLKAFLLSLSSPSLSRLLLLLLRLFCITHLHAQLLINRY